MLAGFASASGLAAGTVGDLAGTTGEADLVLPMGEVNTPIAWSSSAVTGVLHTPPVNTGCDGLVVYCQTPHGDVVLTWDWSQLGRVRVRL